MNDAHRAIFKLHRHRGRVIGVKLVLADLVTLSLVEGFEAAWLKAKASELKQKTLPSDGSLALTEQCLRGLGFDEEQAKNAVAPLRTLHHLRSKLKGHVAGAEANALRQGALDQHGTYRKHFEDLCSCCDTAMKRIGEAFGSLSGDAANE